MLQIVYRATTEVDRGQVVTIDEARGQVTVNIHRDATADEAARALTSEVQKLLARCTWFQIWRGRVLCADSDSSLAVKYEADDVVDRMKVVEIRESQGLVTFHIARSASAPMFALALTRALECFLAGGQWFQLWEGEIITMDSPTSGLAA
jgi:hypothetical protein